MRTIFHVDMDAFFVSVEELFDPSLKGKPVIVGGRKNERGVVAAASYAARRFGVHSAMPLRKAAQLCPEGIFLEGRPDRYRDYSHRVHAILGEFSPVVEMASVDEAYLDLTGTARLLGPPLKAAHCLHERMKAAVGLNCSIGIATSRLVAKVSSDQAKPNGILWVQPDLEANFLAPLDISRIPGVGKVTGARLREMGIRKVGDLAGLDVSFLERRFGKWGLALAGKARGSDAGGWFDGEIGSHEDPKSISHEHTFTEDVTDAAYLESTLARLAEKVGRRVREHGFYARTVHLKLRYADFSTYTRACTLPQATNIDQDFIRVSRDLFTQTWERSRSIRLIGLGASGFSDSEGQLNLLAGERLQRARRALAAADRMRDRFGEKIVKLASGLSGEHAERVHDNPAGLPGKAQQKGS